MRWTNTLAATLVASIALLGCDDGTTAPATPSTTDTGATTDAGANGDTTTTDTPAEDVAAVPDVPEAPVDTVLPEVWGPAAAIDENPEPGIREYTLTAAPVDVEMVQGVTASMYAYNGQLPGPLLQAEVGETMIVHFTNNLPEPTTIHWHGLRVPPEMDGSPRIQTPVQPGETFTYQFVVPDAGSYWYHPHVRSNEQVEKGLYGALVVHEAVEARPTVDLERYFVLDDILLTDSGLAPFLQSHPEIMHGRNGNVLLVNGSAEPLATEATVGDTERWRLVNTANARTMKLHIEGAKWRVVGTDGGLLPQPFETTSLTLPVGQRYDVEVVYETEGQAKLISTVLGVDNNNNLIEIPIDQVVVTVGPDDGASVTANWPVVAPFEERPVTDESWMYFNAKADPVTGGTQWTINGVAHAMDPLFYYFLNDVVLINLVNQAGPEHPFHLHGQFFEILTRNGKPVGPEEAGLKDTVLVPGMESVTIIGYMDNPGNWMAHCHILEHAELGMMAEIYVGEVPRPPDQR